MDSLTKDLQTLIRQPSESAKNEGIDECATLVQKILNLYSCDIVSSRDFVTCLRMMTYTETTAGDC